MKMRALVSGLISLSLLWSAGGFANPSGDVNQQAIKNWPTKPIKYIVPFSTGGVSDGVARLLSQQLSPILGQNLIIENKPGVSGIVGTQFAARAPADGYTVIGGTITTHAVNPLFTKSLGYDPVADFVPVVMVGTVSNVLVVPMNSPYQSVEQIIEKLKRSPDSLTYGSSGLGTSQHLSAKLFESLTGTKMRQISYKGGSQAMIDLVGGQIDMVFETVAAARPMIEAKSVRILAVTSKARLPNLPNVPTLAEAGVLGFEMQSWQGIFAPVGTPVAITEKLARDVNQVLAQPETQQRLRALGVEPDGRAGDQFAAFQKAEVSKWTKVVKDSGFELE